MQRRSALSFWLALGVVLLAGSCHCAEDDDGDDKGCPVYTDVLHKIYNGPLKQRPQLIEHHAIWISTVVKTTAATLGRPAKYLVFGLGRDSLMWHDMNCGGRTVFLENGAEWFAFVTKANPQLEAYKVSYKGNMDKSEEFFGNPWVMDVPKQVSNTCFDVVLVDSPIGIKTGENYPGRMESSYYALHNAVSCVESGKLKQAFIFLHDMERPLEQEIEEKIFSAKNGVQSFGGIGKTHRILHAYFVSEKTLAAREEDA